MKPLIVAAAALLALAPSAGRAVVCANCTQEATEIAREGKRAVEFGKALAEAKRSAEYELRSWHALTRVRNFRDVTDALGGLSRRYHPDGQQIASMLYDGRSLAQGGSGIERLLSRGTTSRLERTWGSASQWYDNIEARQRVVAVGRQSAFAAMQRAQESLSALISAHSAFSASQGVAEISAGLGAMQLQQLNASHNRTNLEAIRLAIETEQQQEQVRMQEQARMEQLHRAEHYGSAFDRARMALGR